MPDRDAFFAAIRANPDDDGPRLVYADWLEEHGDCAHAELIRVQCELARVPENAAWRQLLESRTRQLFEENRAEGSDRHPLILKQRVR